ncbi:Hint domain-containing protein [Roseicyclus sp.]|uniref:Hint domain-containing protein n=1 Tax=Roseicyclus sp. TaxID=1914329 RepID=UPI003F6B4947
MKKMDADRLYAYTTADFGPELPSDLFAAAQTEAEVPVYLSRNAQPVTITLNQDRLAEPVRLCGMHFAAGDNVRPLWTLIDQAKALRLIALRITAHDRESRHMIGACTVLASVLPLKPGQSYLLARPVTGSDMANPLMVGFAQGSRILTDQGKRLVQDLKLGDRLWCSDDQFRPLIWRGSQVLPARGVAAPVRLRRGCLGLSEDLVIAPLQGVRVETDNGHALAPACAFVDQGQAMREFGKQVTWHHLLLETHALILANGLACDTLWSGDMLAATRPDDWPDDLATPSAPLLPRLSRHDARQWCR